MDPWMPDIPRRTNTHILNPATRLVPTAVVLHRTYGRWAGDMQTLLKGRVPSCHFLVGKDQGNWCQMVPANILANHTAGANSWAIGVELEGKNDEPLTDWQVACTATIAKWVRGTFGIPYMFMTGEKRVTKHLGWLSHANVETSPRMRHYDKVSAEDWLRISYAIGSNVVTPTNPSAPSTETKPMYVPPLILRPIVASLACPTGGAWLLGDDGSVYAFGGAPFEGGANGKAYFVGRSAARLELPTAAEVWAGNHYAVIATSGERYAY